jgi:trimethylamine--corrinoid protein Co-methyltransferase
MRTGARDTAARAGEIVAKRLADYEQPPMDEAIRQELEDYVNRRRAELGD